MLLAVLKTLTDFLCDFFSMFINCVICNAPECYTGTSDYKNTSSQSPSGLPTSFILQSPCYMLPQTSYMKLSACYMLQLPCYYMLKALGYIHHATGNMLQPIGYSHHCTCDVINSASDILHAASIMLHRSSDMSHPTVMATTGCREGLCQGTRGKKTTHC